MNAAHWHLLINHFPIVGCSFLLILLALSLWWKELRFHQITLGLVLLVTVLTYLSHTSGSDAAAFLNPTDAQTILILGKHADAATWSLGAVILGGLLAAIGLYKTQTLKWVLPVLLVIMLLGTGLAAWTSLLGGMVTHTEIRDDDSAKKAMEFHLP